MECRCGAGHNASRTLVTILIALLSPLLLSSYLHYSPMLNSLLLSSTLFYSILLYSYSPPLLTYLHSPPTFRYILLSTPLFTLLNLYAYLHFYSPLSSPLSSFHASLHLSPPLLTYSHHNCLYTLILNFL